ncbi:MAG: hypothetical protein IKJ88_04475 [Clostridia bacterium]|nr:hypothetical protein [Clostridia bacterium]
MRIAKKALSVFLSLLMVFTACAVGLPGIVALAAEGDSKYTKAEVITLVNAAVAGGYSSTSSDNATNITGDNGNVLAAADAIFDYAVKTYREGRKAESAYNSGDTLCEKFISDFSSSFSGTALNAMKALATDVLNPNGTTVYGYSKRTQLSDTYTHTATDRWSKPAPLASVGADVTDRSEIPASKFKSNPPYNVTKTVAIDINLDDYLCGFDTIEDIPSSFLTSVSYTYAHTTGKYAYVTKTNQGGSFFNYKTTTDITTYTWNYMSAKPVRVVTKNTTAKKYLKSIDKFFNADRLALTKADLLEMSLADLEYLNTQADGFRTMMNENFSAETLTHFGFAPDKINTLIDNINFAYRAVAAKAAIDTLNNYIGSEYNKESYAEMSALYAKVSSAYNVVFSLQQDVIDYIVGDGGYAEQYADAQALKAEAEAYIDTLHAIMTEQRLEETVNSMMAKYDVYNDLLDKENIEVPTDDEITHLVSQVASWNGILATYTGYSYYRTYYTTDIEAKWKAFCSKLDEVAEVRGLKADYKNFYDWFYYLLYTTEISDASDDQLMNIYEDTEARLGELRAKYNEIVDKYDSYTIADKIFTINYGGSDYLLQTLIENSKSAGYAAIKAELVTRAEADLDTVMVYSGVTTVNFDNFAAIKSTLSHYNYDLYDYVTGGNREGTNWLSSDYVNKHSMVQTLLDRYHAFSTTNGKSFFNEDFTFVGADGFYAIRYAGDQTIEVDGEDENGNPIKVEEQIGYPNDIARDGADDNYYVDEELLVDTVKKIDNFIISRDFGAIAGFIDKETEEATDLKTYVNQMLAEMLYTDDMLNTLVGAVYPMLVELINTELIGAISNLSDPPVEPDIAGANAAIDVGTLSSDLEGSSKANLFIDDAKYNGKQYQRYLYQAFADLGLYIYPTTLADSLAISNPSFYGKDSEIYVALKAAGRDWSALVCEDDPETLNVDETKVLEFAWGVYDQDSFLDAIACVLDPILPLLQSLLAGASYSESASNTAYAIMKTVKYSFLSVSDVAAYGDIVLGIQPLNLYADLIVPLFQVLGVENIPTLKPTCGADDIVNAIFGTLLKRVDQILDAPLDSILTILPNLVYWLSMDSVQEIIDNLVLDLNLAFELEIDSSNSGTLATILGWVNIEGLINDMLKFDLSLDIGDMLDLYDLLGFEITNFNEVLEFVVPMLGLDIELPPIKQQEIIFCSDWTTRADGSVNLVANKGDLMYWFLDYIIGALVPDENGNSLLTALLGSDMDPTVKAVVDRVVSQLIGNPKGVLAAVIELLNPTTYDLEEMDWIEQGDWNYNGIVGANNMSIVYLNYGNDWTQDDANYLVDNIDEIAASVLEMTGMEIDDLGGFLQDKVNGLFTNANITALVEMLCGLGDSPSGVILDIVANQVGVDISSWFNAFGYLYPEGTWAEDAEVIRADSLSYVNNFGIEGVANEDGTISWFFNRMPLVDGDGYTFINILSRLLGSAEMLIKFLFAGEDISAFEDLITVKGYETYDTTFGLLLTMLGVENIPTQADFNADAMGSFNNMLHALLDWFYTLTSSDDMIAQLLELIPDVFYFIESNGLSTFLHNLLMPVWVLVDTVRPILNVDINGLLSVIASEVLNYGTLNIDVILEYLIHGIYMKDDFDFVYYAIDINNLRLSDVLTLADTYFGSNLATSGLVKIGLKGLCSGIEKVENTAVGTIYATTVTAADAITILITGLLECLTQPAKDAQYTNGDVIFGKLAELTGEDFIADLYSILVEIITGVEYEYTSPDWGYMFESSDLFSLTLPEQSVVYLGYTTDWTEETAATVYDALDDILNLVLPEVLEEGETLATLINGVLTDNVYTDEILNTVVEALVNLIAGLDETLRDTVDVVINTNIAEWFTMCELNEETGKYECTETWGVDAAAEADKKDIFVAGIKEVLAPANQLLAWLFFGDDYKFFTGSETNEDGEYIYNDIITITGGQGYAYGIAPILEALGCTMQPADAYYDAATKTYNVGNAVEDILDAVLSVVDAVAANPVEEAFKLIPNLVYFINANGLVSSVNNLLAPLNTILEMVSDLTGGVLVNTLLQDLIGFDITNLSTETLLGLAIDNGVNISPEMINIICDLYVGNLTEFTAANGNKAYRLDVTGYEGDVLTLILSIALDLFNLNPELFSNLLGKETYTAVAALLKGLTINFVDINWAYMYDGDLDKLNNDGFPEQTIDYLGYTTDWDEETAALVYDALDEVLALVLDSTLEEGENIATLVNGLLNDNVYSDAVLNSVVELIVNALASLDEAIYEAAGAVLDADIATWFGMCELNADGKYVCTKNWGVDEAADKKAVFVAGIKEVLKPANKLLSWLFFGEKYELLNGTTNEVLITINGGQGYAYGLVPILEALGCTMQPASAFKTADGYDVGAAVESILDAALKLVDDISANPVEEVFELLPNVFYFINAEGLKASVTNLLAPVNAVVECLNPLIGEFSIGAMLTDLAGFDVSDITVDTILAILKDNLGFTVNDEMAYVLKNLYVGEPTAFDSASGRDAYKVAYTEENAADVMLTILLSFALDAFNINAELFSDLLGEETYYAVKNLILGASEEFTYREMNWAYMYEGEDALSKLYNDNLPERTGDAYTIYTQYQNNWNKATAEELDTILDELVDAITKAARGSESSLGKILDDAISGGLYQDSILNSLIEMVVELLVDYEQFVAGAGAILGAEGLADWFGYCEITTDANGKTVVKCTKDWGIDSAATNDAKREAFINGFVTALQPAYRLLAWLLFGEDYTFFNGTTNEVLVTITGGEGYDNAIVPLLEGVSATMRGTDGTYLNGKSAIKSADEYYVNGELNMEQAVRDVFTAVTDWLYDICGDLANQSTDGTLTSMLDKLANFIYFVNADGLKVVVNNLLVPVNSLIDALKPFGVELNIADLIDLGGADITDFDFYDLFVLLEDLLALYFPDYTQDFLATFYIGQVVKYESANGKLAYYMTYSEEETRADMITCIISFVVDAFEDPRNAGVLSGWLGADAYNAIINVLNINAAKAMQDFSWLYTEYADTDEIFTPIDSSVAYGQAYDEIWTEEMAQYIADNLVDFTTKIIALLGLEINGYQIKSVEDLIDSYLNGDLYTQATADSILDFFKNLTDMLGDYAEIGDMAIAILDNAIGTSMGEWATMEVTVEDGNRESFVAALKEILAPIVPLLDVLLCGEDLTFFYSCDDGSEQITIPGSEGYAYGIIPLFEALGCTMLTPDEFYALEDDAKIGAILDALLDRIDVIMLDPVNEIFAMLPAIIYFINSNGLDTSVKNIINTVDTVLMALEPALGEADLMSLLGVDLADYNFEYLAQMLADMIGESTNMEVEALIVDAVAELTMGKVITYQSANGETYYTMVYANDEQLKDMVTILLRLAVDFLATAENADAIAALLVSNTDNEEAADSVRSFISLVLQGLGVKPATSGAMATIYYIFYGLKQGVDVVYDNYYDSWIAILDIFKEDERPIIDKLVTLVGGILGDFADFENGTDGTNCKCNCHSTNAIVSLIHTILNIIRRILRQTEYQYCACGVDHWDFSK